MFGGKQVVVCGYGEVGRTFFSFHYRIINGACSDLLRSLLKYKSIEIALKL